MRLLLVCVVATSVALSVSICIVAWFRKGISVKDVEGGAKQAWYYISVREVA